MQNQRRNEVTIPEPRYAIKSLNTFNRQCIPVKIKQRDAAWFYQFPPHRIQFSQVELRDQDDKIDAVRYFYHIQDSAGLLKEWKMNKTDIEESNYCIVKQSNESYSRAQISYICKKDMIICNLIDSMEYVPARPDQLYYLEYDFGFLPTVINVYVPALDDIDQDQRYLTITRRLLRTRVNWNDETFVYPLSQDYGKYLKACVTVTAKGKEIEIQTLISSYLKDENEATEEFNKFRKQDFLQLIPKPVPGITFIMFDSIARIPYVGADWGLQTKIFFTSEFGDSFCGRICEATNEAITVQTIKDQKISSKILDYYENKRDKLTTTYECGCLPDGYHFIVVLPRGDQGMPYRCQILSRKVVEDPSFGHEDNRRIVKVRLFDTGQIMDVPIQNLRPLPWGVADIPMQHILVRWVPTDKNDQRFIQAFGSHIASQVEKLFMGHELTMRITGPLQIKPMLGSAMVDVVLYPRDLPYQNQEITVADVLQKTSRFKLKTT